MRSEVRFLVAEIADKQNWMIFNLALNEGLKRCGSTSTVESIKSKYETMVEFEIVDGSRKSETLLRTAELVENRSWNILRRALYLGLKEVGSTTTIESAVEHDGYLVIVMETPDVEEPS